MLYGFKISYLFQKLCPYTIWILKIEDGFYLVVDVCYAVYAVPLCLKYPDKNNNWVDVGKRCKGMVCQQLPPCLVVTCLISRVHSVLLQSWFLDFEEEFFV